MTRRQRRMNEPRGADFGLIFGCLLMVTGWGLIAAALLGWI